MERFFRGFLSGSVISVPFATLILVMVGLAHFLGFAQPNYFPEEGETLLGFYSTLWASVAVPLPILIGSLSALQGLVRGDLRAE